MALRFSSLNENEAAKSIVVTNIPKEAREEDILRHGGGEIDRVRVMRVGDSGTAVVTFRTAEGWWATFY